MSKKEPLLLVEETSRTYKISLLDVGHFGCLRLITQPSTLEPEIGRYFAKEVHMLVFWETPSFFASLLYTFANWMLLKSHIMSRLLNDLPT